MSVTWSVDENGFMRGFAYHDGYLDGVLATDGGKVVHLAFRSIQGEARVLTLRDVAALCVDEFRQGNIIANLWVLTSERLERSAELRRRVSERLYLEPQETGSKYVFHLDSSYGAEVTAVCGGIEVSDVGVMLSLPAKEARKEELM